MPLFSPPAREQPDVPLLEEIGDNQDADEFHDALEEPAGSDQASDSGKKQVVHLDDDLDAKLSVKGREVIGCGAFGDLPAVAGATGDAEQAPVATSAERIFMNGDHSWGDSVLVKTPEASVEAHTADVARPVAGTADAPVAAAVASSAEAPNDADDPALLDGDCFLDELRGPDSDRAARLCLNASTEVINAIDGTDNIRALLIVAAEGHAEACKALLERYDFEGVNACDVIGSNALHLAAGNDNIEVCEMLLACPRFLPGINAQNYHMRTALDFATDFGDGDAVGILKAAGGLPAGSDRKEARKSGRWIIQPTLVEPDYDLPALDELQGEPEPDMDELD